MQNIKFNELEGFPTALDWGDLSDEHCRKLQVVKKSRFIVLENLGVSFLSLDKLGTKDIIKLGIKLLDRIEKLHDIGILHLDIKADNILNGPKVVCQLAPFQSAK